MSENPNVNASDDPIEDVNIDAVEDQAGAYLDDSSESDDLPVTPPESRPINAEIAYGLDEDTEETIDQRILQEEPEAGTAYGKPESGVDVRREEGLASEGDLDVDADETAEESAMHLDQE